MSVSIVVLASLGGEWATRDEVTVSDEDMEWNQERAEADALMESLSAGVRARYEGVVLEQEEARHTAFAKERLRWMRARASGK